MVSNPLGAEPSRGDALIVGNHLKRLLEYLRKSPTAPSADDPDVDDPDDPDVDDPDANDIAAGADADATSGAMPAPEAGGAAKKDSKKPGSGGKVHAIGDIHGMYKEMMAELKGTGYVDDAGNWSGGDATLAFTGDLVDRGPQGYEVVQKIMELQEQAKKAGGEVIVTLGNHDIFCIHVSRTSNQGRGRRCWNAYCR